MQMSDATQRVYSADKVPAEMLLDYQLYQQRKLQESGEDGRRDARKQKKVAVRDAEEQPFEDTPQYAKLIATPQGSDSDARQAARDKVYDSTTLSVRTNVQATAKAEASAAMAAACAASYVAGAWSLIGKITAFLSGGHVRALHCDAPDGVLICLGGERRVALLPPRMSTDTDAWVGAKPSPNATRASACRNARILCGNSSTRKPQGANHDTDIDPSGRHGRRGRVFIHLSHHTGRTGGRGRVLPRATSLHLHRIR